MNVGMSFGAFYAVNPDRGSHGMPTVAITPTSTHGTAGAASRDELTAFPARNPYAACNAGGMRAMGVTYTPAFGYADQDAFTIEEVNVDGNRQALRIEPTVM